MLCCSGRGKRFPCGDVIFPHPGCLAAGDGVPTEAAKPFDKAWLAFCFNTKIVYASGK